LLDRGPEVKHLRDYPTASTYPWEFEFRGALTDEQKEKNPIAEKCYAFKEGATHFFAADAVQPYKQEKPFEWLKGYQVGGKSLMWARQTQRWSKYDFNTPKTNKFGIEWPIDYEDLAPWYSHVEKFVGISGEKDGLDVLPDGEFLPSKEITTVDKHLRSVVSPFGGYFSANSSTVPWAQRTGNLTLIADSVVHSVLYDEQTGKAKGVKVNECLYAKICESQ